MIEGGWSVIRGQCECERQRQGKGKGGFPLGMTERRAKATVVVLCSTELVHRWTDRKKPTLSTKQMRAKGGHPILQFVEILIFYNPHGPIAAEPLDVCKLGNNSVFSSCNV